MAQIKRVLPAAVALRHEDRYTHGIPDLSLTLHGTTTWWEIKYADPRCESKEIQRYLCQRLEAASFCRYVIYQRGVPRGKKKRPRQIRIVPPSQFDGWQKAGIVVSEDDFSHHEVVEFMAKIHGVKT